MPFPWARIFWPPQLVVRQFASMLWYAHLSGWRLFPRWIRQHSFSSLPIAAGAMGMGCIGYPSHPVWEVTSACNLSCLHCHVAEPIPSKDELSTEEGKALIDQLRTVDEFRMLVYSGGEPLVRHDLFDLLAYSYHRGFFNVIATNGTLIDAGVARQLKKLGVAGIAVSLDSSRQEVHNKIRTNAGAFAMALNGIKAVASAGIPLQINVTAMEYNFSQLEELLGRAQEAGAVIVLVYQLLPVGRGAGIHEATLDIEQNRQLLTFLAAAQSRLSLIVEPVASPQYWPYLLEQKGIRSGLLHRLSSRVFHGCCAGRGFVYLKANGDVWPCPFIPMSAGNVRQQPFNQLWQHSQLFESLRQRESLLQGACGRCSHKQLCGGCRGRALAFSGGLFDEDPQCCLAPKGGKQ